MYHAKSPQVMNNVECDCNAKIRMSCRNELWSRSSLGQKKIIIPPLRYKRHYNVEHNSKHVECENIEPVRSDV
jgi:hypothetical protein